MELEKYKVQLDPKLGIILVEHPSKSVSLLKLKEIKESIEKSTKSKYSYGVILRVPGYYFSYRLIDEKVIVCGNMSKKETIEETKKFISNAK
jgi:hypothetical protein